MPAFHLHLLMSSTSQASSAPFPSLSFPSPPKSPVFPRKVVLFARLPTARNSSRRSSSNTLILNKRTERLCPEEISGFVNRSHEIKLVGQNNDLPTTKEANLDFDKKNSMLQVLDLVQRIRALPPAQRTRILDILDVDCGFQTVSDFNDLLMALVTADEPELALKLYSNLSCYGLVPNCLTHSIMIRCYCKKGDPTEAKRVIDQMVENGMQPTVATFTVLINAFCRGGRVRQALEVLGIMGRIKCQPTIQTYNCLLKGLCYVGKVEKAYQLLTNIKKSSTRPDIYTYAAVMDGFCKVGRSDEASELLDEALGMGLTPNVFTFNTLFTGYCKEGRPLEGIGLLKEIKDRKCMPDYISYSTLLHGLLKWGKIHSALLIYEEMVGVGFQVDERMMNTLLRGLCRRSRKEREMLKYAYQVFDKMKRWAFVIYCCTYDLMIEAFCTGKDADKALVSLNEMVGAGHVPKNITFNNVMRALCDEGKLEEALSVFVVFRGSGIPAKISFNILISEFNRQGRPLGACNVYCAALKVGVVPDRKPRGCST